ncbi:three-helix bundle dimerization domain-containing protein [Pseudarthrobacter defluvii]
MDRPRQPRAFVPVLVEHAARDRLSR